ncbi:outer membrane protein 3 [Helicobacter cetorum MIT 99-5656]|uniref:Outer membrane protein 3 n=2 Tax=Helicobacter cetorum TaxID=138563 RepID=I0EUH0_HELCM|nr:outer membrane protein 3 [Helicobacter cetorum MIT 99-5656]
MKERIRKEVRQEIAHKKAEEKTLHDQIMQEELKKEIYKEELEKANIGNKSNSRQENQKVSDETINPQKQETFLAQERQKKFEQTTKRTLDTDLNYQNNSNNPQIKRNEFLNSKAKTFTHMQDTDAVYADKRAFYLGLGYQLGLVESKLKTTNYGIQIKSLLSISGMLEQQTETDYEISNGFGVVLGYKWVGKSQITKYFGFRWGLFYDLTASTYNRGDYFYENTINTETKEHIYKKNGDIKISTYGTYLDFLVNAYNGEKFFIGSRFGLAFGGSSYSVGDKNVYESYLKQYVGGNLTYKTFQFIVDVGVRMGGKHSSFEWGVKFPTISNTYMQANINAHEILSLLHGLSNLNAKLPYSVTFQRNLALYFNYIYSF